MFLEYNFFQSKRRKKEKKIEYESFLQVKVELRDVQKDLKDAQDTIEQLKGQMRIVLEKIDKLENK